MCLFCQWGNMKLSVTVMMVKYVLENTFTWDEQLSKASTDGWLPALPAVEEPKEADIIWTSDQIDEEVIRNAGIQAHQYINQFPFESCLVMKHHLAQTMQQVFRFSAMLWHRFVWKEGGGNYIELECPIGWPQCVSSKLGFINMPPKICEITRMPHFSTIYLLQCHDFFVKLDVSQQRTKEDWEFYPVTWWLRSDL